MIIKQSYIDEMDENIILEKELIDIYDKQDIMKIFKCESDKALRILKILYQMKMANKIGREYYVTKDALNEFLGDMRGKEVYI